jgi:hypothetical protein
MLRRAWQGVIAMRGTTDEKLYDKFVTAVLGFPPTARDNMTAEQVFQSSYSILGDLAEMQPEFPRAIGWKAYALALSVYEGWRLPRRAPEEGLSDRERLDQAKGLAQHAIDLDQTDFDLHWLSA